MPERSQAGQGRPERQAPIQVPAWLLHQATPDAPPLLVRMSLAFGRFVFRWTGYIALVCLLVALGGSFSGFVKFSRRLCGDTGAHIVASVILFYLPVSVSVVRYCRLTKDGLQPLRYLYSSMHAFLGIFAALGYWMILTVARRPYGFAGSLTYYVMMVIIVSIVAQDVFGEPE